MRVKFFSADLLDGHSLVFVALREEVELKLSAEDSMQQRLFQIVQCCEFAFVDGGEVSAIFQETVEGTHDLPLFVDWWNHMVELSLLRDRHLISRRLAHHLLVLRFESE